MVIVRCGESVSYLKRYTKGDFEFPEKYIN